MKKTKSNNELDVKFLNGVLSISVDGVVVYNAADCFTDGVWNDSNKFDRKIRLAVKKMKELADSAKEVAVLDEKAEITTIPETTTPAKEDVIIPEVIELADDVPEGVDILAEVPTLGGEVVDKFVENLDPVTTAAAEKPRGKHKHGVIVDEVVSGWGAKRGPK